jgi:putative ABC transport system ATP-binding protein
MKKILELQKVTKFYKRAKTKTIAIKDISLTLEEGEDMAVIGASGSGKTTLLNMMGGLDKPSEGTVIIDGKDISKLNDEQLSNYRNKTIGFIFQFFNLQDYLRAFENVMVPMLLSKNNYDESKKKSLKLLSEVGLSERVNYYPSELSGGELQRVAIARSLANDPKILLADEPTANLDRASANMVLEIFGKIKDVHKISVIVITHDTEVSKRFKRVVTLRDGELVDN